MRSTLDPFLDLVEREGVEISATLLVAGVVIVGHITPELRYRQWLDRHALLLATPAPGLVRAAFELPPPIADGETTQVRREWLARLQREGLDPRREHEIETVFDTLYLRGAEVRAGAPETWRRYPYLAVATSAVAAFTPVIAPEAGG